MTPPLTAEQRAAFKTRADRVQEIVAQIEKLESWRGADLYDDCLLSEELERKLAMRMFGVGIDTLIAQLEQELADLDRPKVLPPNASLEDRLNAFSGIPVEPRPCLHISRDMNDNCMECGKQAAADLGNGALSERQIARYPVLQTAGGGG